MILKRAPLQLGAGGIRCAQFSATVFTFSVLTSAGERGAESPGWLRGRGGGGLCDVRTTRGSVLPYRKPFPDALRRQRKGDGSLRVGNAAERSEECQPSDEEVTSVATTRRAASPRTLPDRHMTSPERDSLHKNLLES